MTADPARCEHDLRRSWTAWRADVAANQSSISMVGLLVYRMGHAAARRSPGGLAARLWRAVDLAVVKLVMGADIPASCCIGAGLRLEHGGKGVVCNENVVIGRGVTIYHQVTIGWKEVGRWDEAKPVPRIGDGVVLGAGAKVLGGITVGDGSVVGANAVVLGDVPPGAVAVGVPARVIDARG
jgi:serine O-acetyltransferase